MSETITGGTATSTFGVFTTISGLADICRLNNLKYSESVDVAERRDEEGKVLEKKAYSRKTSVTGDGTLSTATLTLGDIRAGKSITIDENEYMLTAVDVSEANTDFAKFNFTAETADGGTITEYEE